MSQLKTNSITNIGNTGDANIVLGDSGDTQVQSLNSGPLSGFRNQIINGGTYIWQRGTSAGPVAGGGYSADHVFISDGVTWTRAPSASFAPGLEFGLRFSGGANCYAAFPVELLRVGYPNQFANGTQWTFSYYADRGTDHSPRVYFSDGPVPTNAVDVFPTAAPTPLGGNRYSVTFTVAATPAASNTCLVARVLNTTGALLEITGAQLEPGPVATPFEHRPIGTELALCQRYYLDLNDTSVRFPVTQSADSTSLIFVVPTPVPMRASPTATGQASKVGVNTGTSFGTGTINPALMPGSYVRCSGAATFTATTNPVAGRIEGGLDAEL